MATNVKKCRPPKADIRFQRCGLVSLHARAFARLGLEPGNRRISFHVDAHHNLYLRADPKRGLAPCAVAGRYTRYHSATVCRAVFALPDVPPGLPSASFRLGQSDDGVHFPVITRRVVGR